MSKGAGDGQAGWSEGGRGVVRWTQCRGIPCREGTCATAWQLEKGDGVLGPMSPELPCPYQPQSAHTSVYMCYWLEWQRTYPLSAEAVSKQKCLMPEPSHLLSTTPCSKRPAISAQKISPWIHVCNYFLPQHKQTSSTSHLPILVMVGSDCRTSLSSLPSSPFAEGVAEVVIPHDCPLPASPPQRPLLIVSTQLVPCLL